MIEFTDEARLHCLWVVMTDMTHINTDWLQARRGHASQTRLARRDNVSEWFGPELGRKWKHEVKITMEITVTLSL